MLGRRVAAAGKHCSERPRRPRNGVHVVREPFDRSDLALLRAEVHFARGLVKSASAVDLFVDWNVLRV